jgi:carbon-monoxide dehydrogenase small subunit
VTEHISFELNGRPTALEVEPQVTLADALRTQLGLTGTHVGCEHGVCGACTVHLDGRPVRSCLLFAVQADGARVRTVEDLAADDGTLARVQECFIEQRGFQCGFCTPGLLMALTALAERPGTATRDDVVETVSSHICRCTGYASIVAAGCSLLGLADEGGTDD